MTRGNYFDELAYVRADVAAGTLHARGGTRIVALTGDFLRGLGESLSAECGPAANRVLKSAGKTWGRQFAERVERELGDYEGEPLRDRSFGEFAGRLAAAFSHHGFGTLALDAANAPIGVLVARLANAPEGPELLGGFLAGVFSHFAGQDLDALATESGPTRTYLLSLPERLAHVADAPARGQSHAEVLAALAEVRAE